MRAVTALRNAANGLPTMPGGVRCGGVRGDLHLCLSTVHYPTCEPAFCMVWLYILAVGYPPCTSHVFLFRNQQDFCVRCDEHFRRRPAAQQGCAGNSGRQVDAGVTFHYPLPTAAACCARTACLRLPLPFTPAGATRCARWRAAPRCASPFYAPATRRLPVRLRARLLRALPPPRHLRAVSRHRCKELFSLRTFRDSGCARACAAENALPNSAA